MNVIMTIMKKFLVLTATSIISMFICCVYANTSEVDTTMQTEDCKRAGNVEVRTVPSTDGSRVKVVAYNYNDYRVTVKYTLYATNGIKTYPINSGVFAIAAKGPNGPGERTSAWVSVPDGYSYYLEFDKPENCS